MSPDPRPKKTAPAPLEEIEGAEEFLSGMFEDGPENVFVVPPSNGLSTYRNVMFSTFRDFSVASNQVESAVLRLGAGGWEMMYDEANQEFTLVLTDCLVASIECLRPIDLTGEPTRT